ncbi:hypothetical protein C8035_v004219 [Colletotrichum spinosum]|uniref:BZIP domain-containing protein n=1 Tax=Colletotrichum spinosum TaxID=1347390 RepID=A0A4R8PV93_9PEZI|nr:hypothetical protein C8035_v004219 [Colletotrichum spinosum]
MESIAQTGVSDAIMLAPMREREEIREAGEDWTGVTSTAERRKLQNRLNQRAARRRKRLHVTSDWPLVNQAADIVLELGRASRQVSEERTPDEVESFVTPDLVRRFRQFADESYLRSLQSSPRVEHLPTVMHVNVLNAFVRNSDALGMAHLWLVCDAVSPVCQSGPMLGSHTQGFVSCPENLRPTRLQLEVAHHPWIDLLPVPRFRDNIIRGCLVTRRFDEDDLWYDVVEPKDGQSPAMVTWGNNPWDARGWEATGEFLRKWGFLLEGCEQILASTNFWRARRGERRLASSAMRPGVGEGSVRRDASQ